MSKFWMVLIAALSLAACGDNDVGPRDDGLPDAPGGPSVHILALGDSLFAGYQLAQSEAFPAQLEAGLRARGINAVVRNAGVSGDTTAAGLQRVDFVLDSMSNKPDLALIELGANDMLRGLPPEQARANLDAIMAKFKRRDIPMVLMGMRAAPNLGRDYAREFDTIFPDLAEKYNAELVPFFIQPLMFDRSLVQRDQVHPTADGVTAMVGESIDTIENAID